MQQTVTPGGDYLTLPDLIDVHYYDTNQRAFEMHNPPRFVFSGDKLITQCTYNTLGRLNTTVGGYDPGQELCAVYLAYYPLSDWTTCYSIPYGMSSPTNVTMAFCDEPRLVNLTTQN